MRILYLPFPPSVNTYWRHVLLPRKGKIPTAGDVRTLISKKGRSYREQVGKAVLAQGQQRVWKLKGRDRSLFMRSCAGLSTKGLDGNFKRPTA